MEDEESCFELIEIISGHCTTVNEKFQELVKTPNSSNYMHKELKKELSYLVKLIEKDLKLLSQHLKLIEKNRSKWLNVSDKDLSSWWTFTNSTKTILQNVNQRINQDSSQEFRLTKDQLNLAKAVFDAYDDDLDGFISLDHFTDCIRALGVLISDADADELIKLIASSQDFKANQNQSRLIDMGTFFIHLARLLKDNDDNEKLCKSSMMKIYIDPNSLRLKSPTTIKATGKASDKKLRNLPNYVFNSENGKSEMTSLHKMPLSKLQSLLCSAAGEMIPDTVMSCLFDTIETNNLVYDRKTKMINIDELLKILDQPLSMFHNVTSQELGSLDSG